jgi:DNA-binding response OmpR family regulator
MPDRGPLLLVDDDEAFRHILATWLRHRGYAVVEANSAEAAEDVLAFGPAPAMVLLDLNLPGNTGWELLRSERFARADAPPVVIASAVTVDHRRLASFAVAGYLPKPFPLETLQATVERVLASVTATPEATA